MVMVALLAFELFVKRNVVDQTPQPKPDLPRTTTLYGIPSAAPWIRWASGGVRIPPGTARGDTQRHRGTGIYNATSSATPKQQQQQRVRGAEARLCIGPHSIRPFAVPPAPLPVDPPIRQLHVRRNIRTGSAGARVGAAASTTSSAAAS